MTAQRSLATPNETAETALARSRKNRVEPVLIAGAGIGGLAAAIALARRGIASHVLEQRAAFHEEGAGIQIGPNGTRILKQLKVAEALRPRVGLPEAIRVRDGTSGTELARLPLGRWIAARHGAPYWVAHRKDLHAALLQTARAEPLVALSMEFDVAEVATEGPHVAVASAAGQAWTGKALIAADGLWSTIRPLLFSAEAPRFAGKSAARSVLPLDALPPEFFKQETGVWLSPDAHVVHYPVSAGAELAVAVIVEDEHDDSEWSAPVHPAWVRQHLPACAEPLADLISEAKSWKRWALHTLPPLRSWSRGPVALLGDAAHPVLPFLAQGGVLALEDAVVLAEALHKFPSDVPGALSWYTHRRRGRAARVAAASRRSGAIYHMSGPLARARNFALRSLGPERLMARYDWLYGWTSG
jgi:2-polyprenyl-6-methoxyphenol hydroxylase-like FAD-dependent oxidoreductase